MYSTVVILGLSLNFGQFDKLIASKLLISFPENEKARSDMTLNVAEGRRFPS